MKTLFLKFALSLAVLGVASPVAAQTVITSPNDPALAGAGVIDFDSTTPGNYLSLTVSFVTFSGPTGVMVESLYSGQYNSTGNYLNNNNGTNSTLTINFGISLAAFGFNYGASDDPWTLSAFDAGNNLIYATTVAPIGGSSNGEFIGIASPTANIAYATFNDDGGIWFPDWVLIDNLKLTEVVTTPEPSTLTIGGLGLAGLLLRRRCPRANADNRF